MAIEPNIGVEVIKMPDKIVVQPNIAGIFWDYVDDAFKRRNMTDDVSLKGYLVELLGHFLEEEEAKIMHAPLLHDLHVVLYTDRSAYRFSAVREIGDAALFTAGVCGLSISRTVMSIDHYIKVGETAYHILATQSTTHKSLANVFNVFSDDLRPYVDILAEISDDHIMPRPQHQDVLAVHARYEATGSERDRKWLLEHNITLLPKPTQEDKRILM